MLSDLSKQSLVLCGASLIQSPANNKSCMLFWLKRKRLTLFDLSSKSLALSCLSAEAWVRWRRSLKLSGLSAKSLVLFGPKAKSD